MRLVSGIKDLFPETEKQSRGVDSPHRRFAGSTARLHENGPVQLQNIRNYLDQETIEHFAQEGSRLSMVDLKENIIRRFLIGINDAWPGSVAKAYGRQNGTADNSGGAAEDLAVKDLLGNGGEADYLSASDGPNADRSRVRNVWEALRLVAYESTLTRNGSPSQTKRFEGICYFI